MPDRARVHPRRRSAPVPRRRSAVIVGVPTRVLVATGPFGAALSAEQVAAAIDGGLRAGGLDPADLCPLDPVAADGALRLQLDAVEFDTRMRRSRAVIIGAERLDQRTLAGSVAFEIATRARQGGVPAYAVARESSLGSFEARILDLGEILVAGDRRRLRVAGRKLALMI